MYKVFSSNLDKEIEEEMNELEKEGYKFVSSNGYSSIRYVGMTVIMHKDD